MLFILLKKIKKDAYSQAFCVGLGGWVIYSVRLLLKPICPIASGVFEKRIDNFLHQASLSHSR